MPLHTHAYTRWTSQQCGSLCNTKYHLNIHIYETQHIAKLNVGDYASLKSYKTLTRQVASVGRGIGSGAAGEAQRRYERVDIC